MSGAKDNDTIELDMQAVREKMASLMGENNLVIFKNLQF